VNHQSIQSDLLTAVCQIQDKKTQNQQLSVFLSPIRQYSDKPQTFPQWAVKFLIENRNELAKQIAIEVNGGGIHESNTLSIVRHIMNSYVYPYVAKNLKFSIPESNRVKRGDHRTALDIFIDEALWEVFNDLKKYYAIYDGKYYCILPAYNKFKESLAETNSYGLTSRTLWVLLEQEGLSLNPLENTLEQLMNKIQQILETRFKYQLEESNEKSKHPNQIFNDLGYYLYKSTSVEELKNRNISPRDVESNKQVIDELIFSLSGIDYKSEQEPRLTFIPKFEGLNLLQDNLRFHIQELAQNQQLNYDIERHLFAPEKPSDSVKKPSLYKQALSLLKKEEISNEITSSVEIQKVYNFLQSLYEVYQIGTTLYNCGHSEEQQLQGELLIEIALIYATKLDEIAVEVEAKLKVNQFEVNKLDEYLANLKWFTSGHNYTKLIDIIQSQN